MDIFLNNGVCVQFSDQVKYLCGLLNALLKDHNDIHRQVKSQYCAANKLIGTFAQCWTAIKILLHAYCMPMYACQLWSKYTQIAWSTYELLKKCLLNYALHTPRIVFAHTRLTVMSGPLMPCLETIRLPMMWTYINCFIQSLQKYNKSSIFLHYLTLLCDGDQLQ